MADPFSIAVSVGGLVSLGIQLLQGLNQYAGSALDSKGRIKAISTDIQLTVQVVQTLDTTIQDDTNRAMMKDDAARLIQETIAQCRDIFAKIQSTLPKLSTTGPRKIDVITWPFIEPKLDLLRGNLEKLKTSLQLLMNVIILAAMSKRQVEQASLDQQRQQIEKLLDEKAAAEARLKVLERHHAQALADVSSAPSISDEVFPRPGQPGSSIRLDMVEQSSAPKVLVQTPSNIGDLGGTSKFSKFCSPNNSSLSSSPSPKDCPEKPKEYLVDRSLEGTDAILGAGQKNPSENDIELEQLMCNLYDDYSTCIQQLKALQEKLETALDGMFIARTNTATAKPKAVGSNDRRCFAREVDRSVWDTYDCLDQRIFGTSAHQKLIEQRLTGENASLFDLVTGRKKHMVDPTHAETPGPKCILRNWFVIKDGINRQVISADIQKYLGNDATVRPGKDRELEGYWIKAYRSLTTEMINDLRMASTKWEQEQRSGRRGTYGDSNTYRQGPDPGTNGNGSYRASTNSPQLGEGYLPPNGHIPHVAQRMPVPEMAPYDDPRGMYGVPPHSAAPVTTAFGDPSMYASHPPRTSASTPDDLFREHPGHAHDAAPPRFPPQYPRACPPGQRDHRDDPGYAPEYQDQTGYRNYPPARMPQYDAYGRPYPSPPSVPAPHSSHHVPRRRRIAPPSMLEPRGTSEASTLSDVSNSSSALKGLGPPDHSECFESISQADTVVGLSSLDSVDDLLDRWTHLHS